MTPFGSSPPCQPSTNNKPLSTGCSMPPVGVFSSNTSISNDAALTSSGTFGHPSTSSFKLGFPAASNPTGPCCWHAQQQSTASCGQNTTNTIGLFGSPGSSFPRAAFETNGSGSLNGTTIVFHPVTGTDTLMKNGSTTSVNIRHQCITMMRDYESKSLEELRLDDYLANRKSAQRGKVDKLNARQSCVVCNQVTEASIGSSQVQNKPVNDAAFPTVCSSDNSATTTSSIFGQPSPCRFQFGHSCTTTTTGLSKSSAQQSAGSSLFQHPSFSSIFGAPRATFGGYPSTCTMTTGFSNSAQQSAGTSLFQPPSFSSFGAPKAKFGDSGFPSIAPFYSSAATSSSIFGQPSTRPPSFKFGCPATCNKTKLFGQPQQQQPNLTSCGEKPTNTIGLFGSPTTSFSTAFGDVAVASNTSTTFEPPNQELVANPLGAGLMLGSTTFPSSRGSPFTANAQNVTGKLLDPVPRGLGGTSSLLFSIPATHGNSLFAIVPISDNVGANYGNSLGLGVTRSNLEMQPSYAFLGSGQKIAHLAQQQTQASQQQVAVGRAPSGYSPHCDTGVREEILNQYRVSPHPAVKSPTVSQKEVSDGNEALVQKVGLLCSKVEELLTEVKFGSEDKTSSSVKCNSSENQLDHLMKRLEKLEVCLVAKREDKTTTSSANENDDSSCMAVEGGDVS